MINLFDLISVAMGRKPSFDAVPSEEEWLRVSSAAVKQSLGGVLAEVFYDKLPAEQFPSHQTFLKWMCMQKKITLDNHRLDERSAETYRIFNEAGFDSCIIKGQAVARYYPKPEERQIGDIDIWVDGDRDAILDFLRSRYEVTNIVYHHAEVNIFEHEEVEVHFTPSWMYNPRINARLQSFFRTAKARQFANFIDNPGFAAPDVRFDAVFSMVHIYRHLLEEGVGLRQVMDYYYILMHLDASDKAEVMETLGSFRMKRFAAALMYVEERVFGLEPQYMLCAPDVKAGKFLLDEIMLSGNFGWFDPRYSVSDNDSRLRKFIKKTKRQMRFITQYPSEVLWYPGYRMWQFLWRKFKKYD